MFSVAVNNQEGELGSNYITDTTLHNPNTGRRPWRAIECISDCTFTILVDQTSTPNDVSSITLVAGRLTFGNFTDIKLGGGKVKAYY
jgi:hypothetical protein